MITQTGFRSLSTQEFDIFVKSDLPTPVFGEIIMPDGNYWIKSLIDLGTDTIVIPEFGIVTFRGLDAFLTGFTSTSTGNLFSSKNKVVIEFALVEMFISIPNGTVFDISSPSFNLDGGVFIFETAFGAPGFGIDSLGTINNMGTVIVASRSSFRAIDTGLTVSNCGFFSCVNNQSLDWNNAGGTMFSFSGTCRNIEFGYVPFTLGASEFLFNFDSAGTYDNVIVSSCTRDITTGSGTVFAAGSLDQNAPNFLFGTNRNIPNTSTGFENTITITLNSNVTDWNPTGWGNDVDAIIIIGNSTDVDINGLLDVGFKDGQPIIIVNNKSGGAKVTLKKASGAAANQFDFKNDIDIENHQYFETRRLASISRWIESVDL